MCVGGKRELRREKGGGAGGGGGREKRGWLGGRGPFACSGPRRSNQMESRGRSRGRVVSTLQVRVHCRSRGAFSLLRRGGGRKEYAHDVLSLASKAGRRSLEELRAS
eukprot:354241-Chlamydomonas_euryale.AAC.5